MRIYANQSCLVRVGDTPVAVKEGQPFDDEDPIVRDYPWLFGDVVEQATSAPGERRAVRTKP